MVSDPLIIPFRAPSQDQRVVQYLGSFPCMWPTCFDPQPLTESPIPPEVTPEQNKKIQINPESSFSAPHGSELPARLYILLPCPALSRHLSGFSTSQSGMSSAGSGGQEGRGPEPGPVVGSPAASCGPEQASQT